MLYNGPMCACDLEPSYVCASGPLDLDQQVWDRILRQGHDVVFPALDIQPMTRATNKRTGAGAAQDSIVSLQGNAMTSASTKLGVHIDVWILARSTALTQPENHLPTYVSNPLDPTCW